MNPMGASEACYRDVMVSTAELFFLNDEDIFAFPPQGGNGLQRRLNCYFKQNFTIYASASLKHPPFYEDKLRKLK